MTVDRGPSFETLRTQARTGGLRFEAYLPPDLADWLLRLIEQGIYADPSEAVFAILSEHQDLVRNPDLRQEVLKRTLEAALADPRPGTPGEGVFAEMRRWLAEPRPEPARWPER